MHFDNGMCVGEIDEIDFVTPKTANVKQEKEMEPDDGGSDKDGCQPIGLPEEIFYGSDGRRAWQLRHARQLNKSAARKQANFYVFLILDLLTAWLLHPCTLM